jgi:NAD(P)-dependent dehydrogenase (short-subunit alcohol dehydrogenase family)
VGFVRSYGKYLPEENITFNAVCPNVIRTNISTPAFYDSLEAENLLTPLESVPDAFEKLLGSSKESGECFETGPNYTSQGIITTKGAPYLDEESATVFDRLYARGKPLHLPK